VSVEVSEEQRDQIVDDGSEAPSSTGSRIFRFIAGFVILVMAMLVGYRYAMNTDANIWYLFQVARHTAWVLDIVGREAAVEPFRETGAASKRRKMAEWEAMDSGYLSLPESQADDRPLTPFESWAFEAHSRIREGGSIDEHGPIVRVILEKGLTIRQSELRTRIRRLKADQRVSPSELTAQIDQFESQLAEVQSQIQAMPPGPERNKAARGRQFTFRVVPDCGAIPSMSIFLAAVLAFPTLWWMRAVGAVGGLSILYVINVLRLATLGYIGAIDTSPGQKWFNFIHEYVWQGIFIVFVVAVWMLWIEFVVKARRA
jgi:exosortase/archaeosortase family protein